MSITDNKSTYVIPLDTIQEQNGKVYIPVDEDTTLEGYFYVDYKSPSEYTYTNCVYSCENAIPRIDGVIDCYKIYFLKEVPEKYRVTLDEVKKYINYISPNNLED